jgi:hypothetical protein
MSHPDLLKCSRCGTLKRVSEFTPRSNRPRGYISMCKPCSAARNLKWYYGLSIEDYERMFNKQNRACAICQRKPGKKNLSVDHDHSCCPGRKSCGKCIRGLLCMSCNRRLLGMICQETTKGSAYAAEVLKRAIAYLERADDRASADLLRGGSLKDAA